MLRLIKHADKTGERGPSGAWPLACVTVDGPVPTLHNFADTFVARAIADGYLSFDEPTVVSTEADGVLYDRNPVVSGAAIVLHLADGDLRYWVHEPPGRYRDEDGTVRVSHEYRCHLDDYLCHRLGEGVSGG